ncbi:MAG: diguanylate cyclase domain-containing protein [Actinomycetota bacterium]
MTAQRLGHWWHRSQFALAVVCIGGYAAQISPIVASMCFALAALNATGAAMIGPAIRLSPTPRAWRQLALGSIMLGISAAIEVTIPVAGVITQPLVWQMGTQGLTIGGYLLALWALWHILHHQTGRSTDPILDVGLLTLGVSIAVVHWLIIPAVLVAPDRPAWWIASKSLYPVFDVAFIGVITLAFFRQANRRHVAFLALAAAFTLILVGDAIYLWAQSQPNPDALRHWWEMLYVASANGTAIAALHPSMATIAQVRRAPVEPWSIPRLLVLTPALAAAPLVLFNLTPGPLLIRIALGILLGLLELLLVVRTRSLMRQVWRLWQLSRQFEHQAAHDPLTGVLNRAEFMTKLDHVLKQSPAGVTALFLDLNNFKAVNDIWGHATGDRVLRKVAARLAAVMPDGALVARLGGDEFAAVAATSSPREYGEKLAAKLRAVIAVPITVDAAIVGPHEQIIVHAAIGIATVGTGETTSAKDLIRQADMAVYDAKPATQGSAHYS